MFYTKIFPKKYVSNSTAIVSRNIPNPLLQTFALNLTCSQKEGLLPPFCLSARKTGLRVTKKTKNNTSRCYIIKLDATENFCQTTWQSLSGSKDQSRDSLSLLSLIKIHNYFISVPTQISFSCESLWHASSAQVSQRIRILERDS